MRQDLSSEPLFFGFVPEGPSRAAGAFADNPLPSAAAHLRADGTLDLPALLDPGSMRMRRTKIFMRLAALILLLFCPAGTMASAPPRPTVSELGGQRTQSGAVTHPQKPTIRFDKTWTPPSGKVTGTSTKPAGATAGASAGSDSAATALPQMRATPRQTDLARSDRLLPHRARHPATAPRSLHIAKKRRRVKAVHGSRLSPLDRLADRLIRRFHAPISKNHGPRFSAEPAPEAAREPPPPYQPRDENALPAPARRAQAVTRRPLGKPGSSGPEDFADRTAAVGGHRRLFSWEERGFPPGPPMPRDETVIEGSRPPFPVPLPPPPPRYRYAPGAGPPYSPGWPPPFPDAGPPP